MPFNLSPSRGFDTSARARFTNKACRINNAYTDSNGVFKNLLGQTDAQALQVAEYGFTTARSIEILGGHVQLEVSGFGLQRLAAIHRHLFQDVYEWAGKIRTVPSSKRAELGGVNITFAHRCKR